MITSSLHGSKRKPYGLRANAANATSDVPHEVRQRGLVPAAPARPTRSPTRPSGGLCRFPDPPADVWQGKVGEHPGTFARVSGGSSRIRRRILKWYGFHPVHDRARIRRWLPKLYAAWSRRKGWPWVYMTLGGYYPAMLITENGAPDEMPPYAEPGWLQIILRGTGRRLTSRTTSPAMRRQRERAKKRKRDLFNAPKP